MIRHWQQALRSRSLDPWVTLGYAAVVALFLWTLAQFYIPGKGLSYLIAFGDNQGKVRLTKIHKLDYYVSKASAGYDTKC